MRWLKLAVLVLVLSGGLVFSVMSEAAVAAESPPVGPATIHSYGFEITNFPSFGSYTPNYESHWTIGKDPMPYFDTTATYIWGPEPNSKRTGTYGLWCAAYDTATSAYSYNWALYQKNTAGRARLRLPELEDYYSSSLQLWWKMPSRGAADTNSFGVLWGPLGTSIEPSTWDDYSYFPVSSSWQSKTFDLSSLSLSRSQGDVLFRFINFVEGGSQSPAEGQGPTIDDVTVRGYKYGPVRDVVAEELVPGTVALTWAKPFRAVGSTVIEERSVTYLVWRKATGDPTWDLLTPSRLLLPAFTDDTTQGGSYTYLIQAWDTDPGLGYGVPVEEVIQTTVPDTSGPEMSPPISSTHPDENTWYSDNAPLFAWDPAVDSSGIEGYAYSMSTDPVAGPPETVMNGPGDLTATFGDRTDGVWYFRVKAKDTVGNWGSSVSRTARIDTSPPVGSIVIAGGDRYTRLQDVVVSSAIDFGVSGAHPTQAMRFDTGTGWSLWMSYSADHALTLSLGDGETTVTAQFQDQAGNVSVAILDTIIFDETPPSGSIAIAADAAYTTTRDVVVTSAIDFGASGAHATQAMRFDTGSGWGSWIPFSNNRALTLPAGDGEKIVSAQFSDAAGNVSATLTDTIILDATPPPISSLLSSTHPVEAEWYSLNNVGVAWSAVAASGIDGYSTSWSTDVALMPDETFDTVNTSDSFTGVADGTWYFRVRALNGAGVWGSAWSRTIRVDTTDPAGTITLGGGAAYTGTQNIQVTSDIDFGASGAHPTEAMRFDTGSGWGAWTEFGVDHQVTLLAGDGEKTVSAQFQDAAGNISATLSDTIILDSGAPAITSLTSSSHPAETMWYSNRDIVVSWAAEALSGIDGYSVSLSTNPATTPDETIDTTDAFGSFADMADGVWYFKVRARNGLGVWGSTSSRMIRIDTSNPSGSIAISDGASYVTTQNVVVTNAIDFGASGAHATEAMRFDTGAGWTSWMPYSADYALTLPVGDGETTVSAQFQDQAGNTSAILSDTVILDATPPTGSITIDGGAAYTTSANVTLSLSIDFGASGAHATEAMRFDTGTGWTSWMPYSADYALTLPAGDGEKMVSAQFRDAAGNVSATLVDTIVLDTTPPVVKSLLVSTHPVEAVWYPGRDVAVSWTAESASGIDGYSTSWSTNPAMTPDETVDTHDAADTFADVADGVWYFKVRARSGAGVWGSAISRTVRVDGTAPSGTITIAGGAAYTATPEVLVTSLVDFESSGAHATQAMRFDVGSGWSSWMPFDAEHPVTLPTGDGVKTVSAQFKDAAQNESSILTDTIGLDQAIPVGSVQINGGAIYGNSTNVVLSSVVEFGPSGAHPTGAMRIDIGEGWGHWSVFDPDRAVELPVGDGAKTVAAQFRDSLGHVSAVASDTITLDGTPPTGWIKIAADAAYTTTRDVVVTSAIDFGASGAHATEAMRFDTGSSWGSWIPYSSSRALTLPAGDGEKMVSAQFRDAAGNVSATLVDTIVLDTTPPVIPIEGDNRYETAVAASEQAYPDGLALDGKRTVIIATGANWPDALGGTSLAGALDGPVLLVNPTSVPAKVMIEIGRLKATKAIILGGTGAVSASVERALKTTLGTGLGIVRRIDGANRYETADKIAKEVIVARGASYEGYAFVATGGNFPDALAAAPLAAAKGWPLYLADPKTGLSSGSKTAMAGVSDVVILGGTGAVSAPTKAYLDSRFPGKVTRLDGNNRYQTAVKVARYAVDNHGHSWNRVGITTGENFPDALAGGVVQGKAGSVMLLTTPKVLQADTKNTLVAKKSDITSVTFFGGAGAVSDAVRDAALLAAGVRP